MTLIRVADAAAIQHATLLLKQGQVVAYPTETLYGLGALAFDCDAVEMILKIKGRPSKQPLPVLVSDAGMLAQVVRDISPLGQALIERYWPGPLTLILPAKRD